MNEIPGWAKWIARDKNGRLYVYEVKPSKNDEGWFSYIAQGIRGGDCREVADYPIFKNVRWEDEEPTPVNLGIEDAFQFKSSSSIEPTHYKRNGKDLIESWKERMSEDQFRESMKTHIDKYVWRYNKKNGVEDLDKATEFIRRLKEWELEK